MIETVLLVIGAGVTGLAVAAELAGRPESRSVTLLERNEKFGLEISSRNSEVIHAGIYYPAGSLKAALCVQGNRLLYRFCEDRGVAYRRTGKLIVAGSDREMYHLEALAGQAKENGVLDLRLLERRELSSLEPNIRARGAILSPSTGIIDTHGLMARLEKLALQRGAVIGYHHAVTGIEPSGSGYRVHFRNPDSSPDSISCRGVVNCGGLAAERIASWTGIDTAAAGYRTYLCKGEYFSISPAGAGLVTHLVYPPPLPELEGLGIHLTLSLDNRARLGPNAFYVDSIDYSVDPSHAHDFHRHASRFLPFLEPSHLQPEMAGIRPKLQGPGDPFRDFVVCHEAGRGLPGLVNLVGIESPGLTASLAIARLVAGFFKDF